MPAGAEPADPDARPSFLVLFRSATTTNEEWPEAVREWGHQSPHNLDMLSALKKCGEYPNTYGSLFRLIDETLKDMGVE